jgi:predicted Co/Zn/Cd cation transporter (cation efflux family)
LADAWKYMNVVCWVAGVGGFFAMLGVGYIIAKKTRATQQEYMMVYFFVMLLAFILLILLWLMLSGISENYNK